MTLVDLVEDLSLRTVEMRLAHQLLANARGNIVQREAWATQAEMSARLGTVTYVLNRALRSLEEEGSIFAGAMKSRSSMLKAWQREPKPGSTS